MSILIPFWNILLAFASFFVCRLAYILQNWSIIGSGIEDLDLWKAFCGSLLFDANGFAYCFSLYVLLMLLPLPLRNKGAYQTACKWYFMVVSAICIIANLGDALYFPYAQRRTMPAALVEFRNESVGDILKICAIEAARNWWLLLLAAAMVAGLFFMYKKGRDSSPMPTDKKSPAACPPMSKGGKIAARCCEWAVWLASIPLLIAASRGGFTRETRPINISNAMRYVNTPAQAAAILNTPFVIIRNLDCEGYTKVEYMAQEEVAKHFSPIHRANCPAASARSNGIAAPGTDILSIAADTRTPNIFIIIVESLSQEFIGAYNDYPCHTPFLDSLRSVSLSPREAFANGNKSIDALPSVLSSVPRLEEHIVLTPYANSPFCSIVKELGHKGYSSAFFHGAHPGSMGFDAFGSSVGIQSFYSYREYCKDSRFGGRKDHDGCWAIWDEEFLQFTALHAGDMKEPFVNTVFTASSHHPFKIPGKYESSLGQEGHPMNSCIAYVDYALRRFFETASGQPWYANTIFVLTADHCSSVSEKESYLSDPVGGYRIPIMFFDPSGKLPRGIIGRSSQQIDIFPTIMGIVGCDRNYIAYGKDLLDDGSGNWTYLYNEIHTFTNSGRTLCFDGENVTTADPCPDDLAFLKAFIQDYKARMINQDFQTE